VGQKCIDMDNEWKVLESDISRVLKSCENEQERQILHTKLVTIRSKLSEVQNATVAKENAQRMWSEHVDACVETQDKIARLEKCLHSESLTPEIIADLSAELAQAQDQLNKLQVKHGEMEAALGEADIVFMDRSTEKAVDMKGGIHELLMDIDKGRIKLKVIDTALQVESKLLGLGSNLSQLDTVFIDELAGFKSSVEVCNQLSC